MKKISQQEPGAETRKGMPQEMGTHGQQMDVFGVHAPEQDGSDEQHDGNEDFGDLVKFCLYLDNQ